MADQGTAYFPIRSEMPVEVERRLDELTFRYGKSYDSYNVLQAPFHAFFSTGYRGAVCFYPARFGDHVIGGLLADDANKPDLLDEFADFCSRRKRVPLLYNIPEEDVPLFRSRDFELTKWGEDPIIDLQSTDWRGKRYEWVRRQENYCNRQGLKAREIRVGAEDGWPELRRQIEAVSDGHIARTTHGRELVIFEGKLDLENFQRRRLFIAENADGVQGLIACNPCLEGRRWAFEIYRRADTAPRGTVPFLFMQIMRAMKDDGIEQVSLSLVPGANCGNQPERHSRYFKWTLEHYWNNYSWLFDMRGLYHFKSRFRPRYEPRYVAAQPHFGLLQGLSFASVWGLYRPRPGPLLRQIGRQIRNQRARRTMAEPSRYLEA